MIMTTRLQASDDKKNIISAPSMCSEEKGRPLLSLSVRAKACVQAPTHQNLSLNAPDWKNIISDNDPNQYT
jgi:hypothetical protein